MWNARLLQGHFWKLPVTQQRNKLSNSSCIYFPFQDFLCPCDCVLLLKRTRCVCVCIPDGKVHHCVQFVPPTSIIGESLQVNHQNARQRPQIKFFGGLLVFLTCWTVPFIKEKNKRVLILTLKWSEADWCWRGGKLTRGRVLPVSPWWWRARCTPSGPPWLSSSAAAACSRVSRRPGQHM